MGIANDRKNQAVDRFRSLPIARGAVLGGHLPLTFVASTFVPVASMPGLLRTIAQWNPVTTLSDALRELFGNPNTPVQPGDPWSIAHPVAYTWLWIAGILLVGAPLAVRAYQRSIRT